jgi:hypothetical protein
MENTTVTTTVTTAPQDPPKQPDIEYHPNLEKYLQRKSHRLAENPDLPNTALPPGFPEQVDDPIVWEGKDWFSEDQWVYQLRDNELNEISDALHHFISGCILT